MWQGGFGGVPAPPGIAPPTAGSHPAAAAAAAAGAAFGLGAVGEGRELELQKEISGTIETQVSRLIEQARHDTESKVKMELKTIRDAMLAMDARLDQLLGQLEGLDPAESLEPKLDADAVGTLLSKIEQQWGQEIRTLKQELHQTILAHNHNADLIKHHKDTIDSLREKAMKMQTPAVKTSELQQHLARLDQRLKQQQKQRKLEPLFERLTVLEQRVVAAQSAAWRYPGMPPVVPPGMSVPPGIPPGMMPPGMGAPGMLPGKSAGAKAAAAGAATGTAAAAAAAASAAGATLAGGAKSGEKAAYKCPTDEEVQAHLSKLNMGNEAPGLELPAPAEGSTEQAA
uniref:Uncharacterized protein n=1 Tax=Alexandrium andersonii TaxID=327968 RepID=A0A7S2ADP2_9DINO